MKRTALNPPFEIETVSASVMGEDIFNLNNYRFCMITGFPVKINEIGFKYSHPLWDCVYIYQGNSKWRIERE